MLLEAIGPSLERIPERVIIDAVRGGRDYNIAGTHTHTDIGSEYDRPSWKKVFASSSIVYGTIDSLEIYTCDYCSVFFFFLG